MASKKRVIKPRPAKRVIKSTGRPKSASAKIKQNIVKPKPDKSVRPPAKRRAQRKYDHKKKVFENKQVKFEQRIAKAMLRPGMMISFKYSGDVVHDFNPFVLVLHPSFRRKLHGINLNYCSYPQILKIAAVVNARISAKALKIGDRYKITNPKGFYHIQLKPILRQFRKSIYRTYHVGGISNQKLMDYKFDATQGKNVLVFNSKDGSIQTKISRDKSQKIKPRTPKKTQQDTIKTVSLNTKQRPPVPLDKAKVAKQTPPPISARSVKNVKTVSVPTVKTVKVK